jgi:hypothetical protein
MYVDGRLAVHVATRDIGERLMGEISARLGSAATLVETHPACRFEYTLGLTRSPRSLASRHRRGIAKDDAGEVAWRAPRAAQPSPSVVNRRSATGDVSPRFPSLVL